MTRNEMKTALSRAVAGNAIADAFAAWREARGIARTGDMSKDQWAEAYRTFIVDGAAGPVTPAPDAAPETDDADDDDQPSAPAPQAAPAGDLPRVLSGLEMFLSPQALTPLKAGIAALERERDEAQRRAAQAETDAQNAAQQVAAPVAPGAVPHARKVATKTLGDLIGARTQAAQSVEADLCDFADAPRVDPNFVWPVATPDIFRAMRCGLNIALWGDRGTGKSSLVRNIAAVTRRPHFEISFHAETSGTELFGSMGIEGDGMAWVPGDLLTAMQTPWAVIDLSEISASRPDLVMQLNAVLEEGSRSIFVGGKRHPVNPTVTFFATTNDNGSGENAARYAGVRAMNDATRSRFIWVEIQTPAQTQLARMIAKAANLPRPAADLLAAFEKEMEKHVRAAKCEATPGIRAWKGFGRLVMAGTSARDAFAMAVEHLGTSDDAAVWRQEFSANFPQAQFEGLARGTITSADPAPAQDDDADGLIPTPTRSGFTPL